ncbi:beta-N-acetylhexosaminidase [Oleidesulfovibrio sp.]|uniref:beta-N-acetylhexosaminidase n=1 Tax=Oleidesulfovibrio sp. TaxID=2909707 RepID=UPI003A881FD0
MKRYKNVLIRLALYVCCVAILSGGALVYGQAYAAEQKASLRDMLGQMLLVGFRGEVVGPDDSIARDVSKYNLGGVILFDRDVQLGSDSRNIRSVEQVKDLTSSLQRMARTPLFVAVDQEGGKVARLKVAHGFPQIPSAAWLGEQNNTDLTYNIGVQAGRMLCNVGINLNFAPVVDVNVRKDSPAIGKLERSFSDKPLVVAGHARAFLQGMQQFGVSGCIKHFPGHGSSAADSHLGVTDISASWSREELVPYNQLIASGDVRMIMTGHLYNSQLDDRQPATLSKAVITGMLREQLGFDGVIVSDDMQMQAIAAEYGLGQAVALALDAGVDILLFGNNLDYNPNIVPQVISTIEELVRNGKVTERRVEESYSRIMQMKKNVGLL